MRTPLEIHRDIQSIDVARLVLDLDFQKFFLRKDLFHNFAAQRQSRRLTLQPFVLLEQRLPLGLKPAHMIRLLGRESLKHQSAAVVLRFARSIAVEGITAAFNREGQFQSVANYGCFEALFFVEPCAFYLLSHARLTKPEDRVPAISFFEVILACSSFDEVFDPARPKFDRSATRIADEMEVVGLTDHRFVPGNSVHFRLTDEPGLQKDLNGAVDRGEADAMPFFQEVIPHLLHRRMPFGVEERRPDQLPLRSLLELLFRKELLQLFALFHRGPIIRYSETL